MAGAHHSPKPAGSPQGLPVDMAQLCIWRTNQASPSVFKVELKVGQRVLSHYNEGISMLTFESYPDGSGRRSTTTVRSSALDGVTLDYASLQLATALPGSLQ